MTDSQRLTPSKKDKQSVCEIRQSIGRGCRNCIYEDVCSGNATQRDKIRKEGVVLRSNPDKQPKTTRRTRTTAKPVRFVETGQIFRSRKQFCEMFKITPKRLQKYIDTHEPIELKLTIEEVEDDLDD